MLIITKSENSTVRIGIYWIKKLKDFKMEKEKIEDDLTY